MRLCLILRLFIAVLIIDSFLLTVHAQNQYAYNPWVIDSLIVPDTMLYSVQLPEIHRVLDGSLQLRLNEEILDAVSAFRFDRIKNQIFIFNGISTADSLFIRYQIQPVLLQKSYSLYAPDTLTTGRLDADTVEIRTPSFQNPFIGLGGNLKRSGSIVRGINIGNNKDLTLNSGLNLQISGQLSEDIEIVAALTDESTPIQPEGNTQSLREVDKVFIQFNSPWLSGVLGDFNLKYEQSAFAAVSRKLQGVSLDGNYSGTSVGGTVASTRGFFNFLSFLGQEGNQGPYPLTGKNGEREIIVLAGTERIWINGEQMVRGETNDYVIEYGNGQITFSNSRLISSESRIEVDFEYYPATQKYTRTVYAARTESAVIRDNLNIRAKYYHEEDDPQQVLEEEGALSAEEKEIISRAGDNPLAASIAGASEVDSGDGSYVLVSDSLVADSLISFYRYVGREQGNYNVTFSFVGQGSGDYVRDRLGVYRWVGTGKGSYAPVRLLSLPVRQQLADVEIQYRPYKNIFIRSELAGSWFDRNRLSVLNDGDNRGIAAQVKAGLDPQNITILGYGIGLISAQLSGRYVDRNFSAIDRINKPDFNRYWNISPAVTSTNQEKSFEADARLVPQPWMQLEGNTGVLRRENFESYRYMLNARWDKERWFRGTLRQEYVQSSQQDIENQWTRQSAAISKDLWTFQPGFEVQRERREGIDPQQIKGFDFFEWRARLGLIHMQYFSGFLSFNRRHDEVFDPAVRGKLIPQATTDTRQLRLELSEWKQWSGHIEVLVRNKNYTKFFEETRIDSVKLLYADAAYQDTVWQDRQTNLAEIVLNNYQWNKAFDVQWQYRISTEQLALREKIYVDVGEGRGIFRFDDKLQEYVADPDGNYILFILPSGRFEPITNLQTSLRLKLDPFRTWNDSQISLQKILAEISSETYIRIDEETKEKKLKDIYLLNLSRFQKENTLRGSIIFNQDIDLLRRNRDVSFRLRYQYRDDRSNQFLDADDNEERLTVERGVRAGYRLIRNIKGQTELRQKYVLRQNQANFSRQRDIRSFIVNQNFSYRPVTEWEFGLESENGWEQDVANQKYLKLFYSRVLLRTTYALLRKGRVTADFDYQNVEILQNPLDVVIPYEMARGKRAGTSKRWQLRGDYTIAENIVVSLYYSGRDDADFEKIIHTGQAEIRAYF